MVLLSSTLRKGPAGHFLHQDPLEAVIVPLQSFTSTFTGAPQRFEGDLTHSGTWHLAGLGVVEVGLISDL